MTTPDHHVPLKPVPHLILLLLAERPTYGVDLVERLEERSGGSVRLNAGSLYRLIARLVDDGLLMPNEEGPAAATPGAPRKVYAVTEDGRALLRAEAKRQADLLELARSLDLVGDEVR
jgi:DNA-binding PadR family transcriptional regulator